MKKLFVIAMFFAIAAYGSVSMKKSRYIDLMEKTLSAYSTEHIERYYNDVKKDGLKEHGYPRLTSNIGILIAHGKRTELTPLFIKMMDLCCDEVIKPPKKYRRGNDFSVKEMIFCLMELEKKKAIPQTQIDKWKNKLKQITIANCYDVYAKAPDSHVYNWAAFTMVSEWMRYHIKLASPDMTFIDNQAASQWLHVEENGMYRDPNNPMVYDLVTRGLFAIINHFGYRGKYFARWDDALKRAGMLTLKMQSVSGEIPFGGRSNQFLHNEAHYAIVMEYEANRYAKLGDMKTAGKFKYGVKRALDDIDFWLQQKPINHVKNYFPRNERSGSQYGCESYAYFDKYMITAASFLYAAYLMSDDNIRCVEPDDAAGASWQTSDHFHKVFLRAGEYFAEYEYKAYYAYDAPGMGRLHRKGAPSAICLSTPGTDKPRYAVFAKDATAFSIVPEIQTGGKWISGAEREVIHKVQDHGSKGETAFTNVKCIFTNKSEVSCNYFLDKNGLKTTVKGNGVVGLMLPAFVFDGKTKTVINADEKTLTVHYKDWICRYQVKDGKIKDSGRKGYNRNGHYKLYRAEGNKNLTVQISLYPASAER